MSTEQDTLAREAQAAFLENQAHGEAAIKELDERLAARRREAAIRGEAMIEGQSKPYLSLQEIVAKNQEIAAAVALATVRLVQL